MPSTCDAPAAVSGVSPGLGFLHLSTNAAHIGNGGVRGSLLGARLVLEGKDDRKPVNDVPFFSANFNYGYAAGLRLRFGKRSFITARYAQMFHLEDGNVVQVADPSNIVVNNDGSVSSSQTMDVTLPPYSVRVGLAINL